MSEKVVLPKEVYEAIAYYENEHGDFWKHHILSDAVEVERCIGKVQYSTVIKVFVESGHLEELLQALVIGCEPEQTPEDKVREYFEIQRSKSTHTASFKLPHVVVIDVLDILNIKIEGVNA